MPAPKKPGWKDDLIAAIKEGKNFEDVTKELKGKYGEKDGKVGASTFRKLQKEAFPDVRVAEVLTETNKERRDEKKKRKVFPMWTPQKQAAGDKSQLAGVINEVIFLAIPCPGQELKLEDIKEINVGGGVVNTVQYIFPQIDLGNPVLILALRVGLLFVKVKKLCYDVKRKLRTGINPAYQTKPEEVVQPEMGISEHPTDKYMREEGIFADVAKQGGERK